MRFSLYIVQNGGKSVQFTDNPCTACCCSELILTTLWFLFGVLVTWVCICSSLTHDHYCQLSTPVLVWSLLSLGPPTESLKLLTWFLKPNEGKYFTGDDGLNKETANKHDTGLQCFCCSRRIKIFQAVINLNVTKLWQSQTLGSVFNLFIFRSVKRLNRINDRIFPQRPTLWFKVQPIL